MPTASPEPYRPQARSPDPVGDLVTRLINHAEGIENLAARALKDDLFLAARTITALCVKNTLPIREPIDRNSNSSI